MRRGNIGSTALLESASNSSPTATYERPLDQPIGGLAKRVLDISIALPLLILVIPLLLFLCLIVWAHDFHSPIFVHKRIGRNGKSFNCLKLRSMVPDSSMVMSQLLESDPQVKREWEQRQKLQVDPRITPLGQILRITSLDELPQLLNVIKGDMSLVGPRPIVDDEIDRYGSRFKEYCACRPGLTGLWQINGRSNCSYAERVIFDAEYVARWSIGLDILILLKTAQIVLSRDGSC